jgi:hypothetical protein
LGIISHVGTPGPYKQASFYQNKWVGIFSSTPRIKGKKGQRTLEKNKICSFNNITIGSTNVQKRMA